MKSFRLLRAYILVKTTFGKFSTMIFPTSLSTSHSSSSHAHSQLCCRMHIIKRLDQMHICERYLVRYTFVGAILSHAHLWAPFGQIHICERHLVRYTFVSAIWLDTHLWVPFGPIHICERLLVRCTFVSAIWSGTRCRGRTVLQPLLVYQLGWSSYLNISGKKDKDKKWSFKFKKEKSKILLFFWSTCIRIMYSTKPILAEWPFSDTPDVTTVWKNIKEKYFLALTAKRGLVC